MRKNTRPDWNAIRAEYISGVSIRKLAEKYGMGKTAIGDKCAAEQWTEGRKKAADRAVAKAVQKTADAAADNAVIAARIRRKALLMIDRLFDEFADMHGTEHRDYDGNNIIDIKRLRDLTTALKDVTGDMPTGGGQTNELLQSLFDLERGADK